MKKLPLVLLLCIAILMAGCKAKSPASEAEALIEPGDKVGNFLITTGTRGNFTYPFEIECSEPGENNSYTCQVAVGQSINISTGIYDEKGSGNLDQIWSRSGYQVFINDRQVDMKAFGTIDYTHPVVGIIRFANVVISSSSPGEITVRDAGVHDNGEAFSSTSIYVFSQP